MNTMQEVTDKIIAMLEQGEIPWRKPWVGTKGFISHTTGKPYSLLNQMMLAYFGKGEGEYLTFLQCQKEGGRVKKGSKSTTIYFWKVYQKEVTDKDGNPLKDENGKIMMTTIPVLKSYQVFHISQCEGIEPRYEQELPQTAQPLEDAEKLMHDYLDRERINLNNHRFSDRAYYAPLLDSITIPCIDQYAEPAEYYGTAFHEITHSTGHPKRLNRFALCDKNAAFGSEEYSKEELTAEIGAAGILNHLGISTEGTLKNSAAYIQNWLKALRDDKSLIVGAASRAEKAMNFILGTESAD